ncbi:hypothetical protein BXY70_1326 [Roseovarius halotolerans]|uniref:Uncharacterized protein n=1 Tax=Roseovarius halotolerans TaxID=505353 RepID=A0A1X6Y5A4_9RHOB|nr:hypothetical protein BXY70_1326 [Roseovarius halotolerans]SLN11190.1 hypothetical protein ROH8110_00070 [Roseovarius halotolerans]
MSLKGWDPNIFVKDYERDLLNARKRAGRKVGRKIATKAKRALGGVDRVRKKQIKPKVARKTGSLIMKDSGPDARVREYGAEIKAKNGGMLRIDFDSGTRGQEGSFIAPGSDGAPLIYTGEGDDARPIAILKKRVKRRAVSKSKRLSDIAEDHFDDYLDQIEEEISNG